MGEKSILKKQYIVEKAKEVFSERGYKNVTMKDVVEACEISRGGLYLYFADTKELFEAVLEAEAEKMESVLSQKNADDTPGDVLLAFLTEQKKEIMKKKDNLNAAAFEYLFENKGSKKDNPLKKSFAEQTKALEKLIAEGVKQDWMACDNPAAAAKNIMYTLEGLKVTSMTYGLSADAMEQEIGCMLASVGLAIG